MRWFGCHRFGGPPNFGQRRFCPSYNQAQETPGCNTYGYGGHCGWRRRGAHRSQWNEWSQPQQQPQKQDIDNVSQSSGCSSNSRCPSYDEEYFGEVSGAEHRLSKLTADFVCDVTLPGRTHYPLDTVLTKTWRLRNSGATEWGNDVELIFFKGNESLALEKYSVPNAWPGQEVDITAVVKTPNKPGRYCTYYRLQRNKEFFGPRLWVDIFAVEEESKMNGNISKQMKQQERLLHKQQRLQHQIEKSCGKLQHVSMLLEEKRAQQLPPLDSNEQQVENQVSQPQRVLVGGSLPQVEVEVQGSSDKNAHGNVQADEQQQAQVEPQVKDLMVANDVKENDNESDDSEIFLVNEDEVEVETLEKIQKDNFQFINELNQLKEMGFPVDDNIKFLLVKHNGQVDRVVQELF
jgi:hypothetical protein